MIKDVYDGLRKRFKALPSFEELDEEFEISTIENEQFLLRSVKKRIVERLEEVSNLLGDLIHPSAESMALMYEWRFFDAKEKKTIYQLYKRLEFLLRSFDEAGLMQDQEHDVRLIVDTTREWKEIRQKCLPFATRLKECWTREEEGREYLGYLG